MSYGDLMPRGWHALPIPFWDEAYASASFGRKSDRAFENVFSDIGLPTACRGAFTPTVDLTLTQTVKTIDVMAGLPGVRGDYLRVELRDNVLSINVERKSERNDTGKAMHRSERALRVLRCLIQLPAEVERGMVEATLADGMLTGSPAEDDNGSDNKEQRLLTACDGHSDERILP